MALECIIVTPGSNIIYEIKLLHSQLDKYCRETYLKLSKYISVSDPSTVDDVQEFNIFVDFSEQQPENAVKGYFILGSIICSFSNVIIDYAVLFPIYEGSQKFCVGITYADILKLKHNNSKIVINFSLQKAKDPIYAVKYKEISNTMNVYTELGYPFYSFNDIEYLKITDIPSPFLNRCFSLVSKPSHIPCTTLKESFCVLFAQISNEHNKKTIKVLQWFPKNRIESLNEKIGIHKAEKRLQRIENLVQYNEELRRYDEMRYWTIKRDKILNELDAEKFHGDVFFELGYISESETDKLHNFMTINSSRLLFGKIENNKITIMGGIKIFLENDYKYPSCLLKIPVK